MMRAFILGILVLFTYGALNAQSIAKKELLDSLENELRLAETDSARVFKMCQLASTYGGIDSAKVFDYGFEALRLAEKNADSMGIANANFVIGTAYKGYLENGLAIDYLSRSKQQCEVLMGRDSSRQSMSMWMKSTVNLGQVRGVEGDAQTELKSLIQVIPVIEKLGDTLSMAVITLNIGVKFVNIGQYDKAWSYYKKAIDKFEKINAGRRLAFSYLTYASCLYEMDSIPQMKANIDKARGILENDPDATEWYMYYQNYGLYLTSKKKYGEAIEAYNKSYLLLKKIQLTSPLEHLLLAYVKVYEKMGDYNSCISYLSEYLQITLKNGNKDNEVNAYKMFAGFEEKLGHYQKAYYYFKKYANLKDSIELNEMHMRINELEIRYQTENNEKAILELTNKNNEAALELEKKRIFGYQMAVIASVLFIVLLIGFILYRAKQRQVFMKEQLHKEELNEMKHQQQSRVFAAMVEGEEKERRRISTDLHDGLGGLLSGIHLRLSRIDNENHQEELQPKLNEVLQTLDDSLVELRGIARNLMPETLKKYGLKAALCDYCEHMNHDGTQVTLQYYGNENLESGVQTMVYRVVQELINNAVKHSKASDVLSQVFVEEQGQINITVEDNGVGFNLDEQGSGLGMTNLKNRVDYLGGILDIQSEKGQGTTINIEIDLNLNKNFKPGQFVVAEPA